jgi:Ser/Thr protein kinase RdoA (MazF antagonist)
MGVPPAVDQALEAYGLGGTEAVPIPGGLLHQSYDVRGPDGAFVLQRVSPVFAPGIHANIRAVTEHLHRRGLTTLRLVPDARGELSVDLGDDGVWRLLTRVPGRAFGRCDSEARARSAAALVARFHGALADLDQVFEPLGIVWHDLDAHLDQLDAALGHHRGHWLYGDVAALAARILPVGRAMGEVVGVPDRVVHMDLKFSNILFEDERATSLIDLDTVCRLPLCLELGDAWRSWCNRNGEDAEQADFDLGYFRAAVDGYFEATPLVVGSAERASLVHGLERLSLELASRFAADALEGRYFGWDEASFGSREEHNLIRARGQLSFYDQVRATRAERARILEG